MGSIQTSTGNERKAPSPVTCPCTERLCAGQMNLCGYKSRSFFPAQGVDGLCAGQMGCEERVDE
ncbi:hypothetical protein GCM10009801_09890 [Streptomyces albiaxialis]|uniref:Uncharacterized protein n=1 Tax=Streptomyces albiaxialis TaxID=329523 RepID=A0ABN2VL13_9ACTN